MEIFRWTALLSLGVKGEFSFKRNQTHLTDNDYFDYYYLNIFPIVITQTGL